jgi:hypothetical protein
MMPYRRGRAAAERFAERRRREDEAPRLSTQVPELASLELEIQELSGATGTRHTRRVVVDRAPALFLLPCGDPRCEGGEHDLTTMVMHALRARETTFRGSDECTGALGPSPCARVVRFEATAKYRPAPARAPDVPAARIY